MVGGIIIYLSGTFPNERKTCVILYSTTISWLISIVFSIKHYLLRVHHFLVLPKAKKIYFANFTL